MPHGTRWSDPVTYAFNQSLGSRPWFEALRLLQEATRRDEISYVIVTKSCHGRSDVSTQLLLDAAARSLETSIILRNAVLENFARFFTWEKASNLLCELQRYGPQATVFTLSAALRGFGAVARWPEALASLNRWPTEVDAVTWGAAVDACVHWERTTELFVRLRRRQVRPNAFMYSSLITAHQKAAEWAAALRTVQLAPGNVVALSSALSLLSRIPTCWSQALELMRGAFPTKLNVVSYGAAIAACGGYGGRWPAALMLFDQLSPQSLQPNLVTFNGYLSALQKAARWEQALSPELGSEMAPLDVPAFGAQVAACAAARSWMQVAALLRELRKCQLQAAIRLQL